MTIAFPPTPNPGDTVTDPVTGSVWTWDGVKWINAGGGSGGGATLPMAIAFPFTGKPLAGALINVPVGIAMDIAPNLAGSQGFADTAATTSSIFTLNKISSGVTAILGTITFDPIVAPAFAGIGGDLAIGDIMQLVAPATQDATLADLGITILVTRT